MVDHTPKYYAVSASSRVYGLAQMWHIYLEDNDRYVTTVPTCHLYMYGIEED